MISQLYQLSAVYPFQSRITHHASLVTHHLHSFRSTHPPSETPCRISRTTRPATDCQRSDSRSTIFAWDLQLSASRHRWPWRCRALSTRRCCHLSCAFLESNVWSISVLRTIMDTHCDAEDVIPIRLTLNSSRVGRCRFPDFLFHLIDIRRPIGRRLSIEKRRDACT